MYWIKSEIEVLRSLRSLAIVAGINKPNDHAELTKVQRLKRKSLPVYYYFVLLKFFSVALFQFICFIKVE